MKIWQKFLAPWVLAAALTLTAGQARAVFAICNQSFDVVNVAIGLFEDERNKERKREKLKRT